MKKIFFLCLLFSCDSKQIKQVILCYENGTPRIIEYNKISWGDTILVKKQELYENGIVKFQTEFDKQFSKCSSYQESGKLIEEKFFINNQLDTIITY